ncbi:hypothetical protein [Sulfurimonas sp. HSL-1716]|uniref:hypothetical protein n=1 Tax=Hydrocurvibacter sulfurireducens TaxID=3131937 RepID=UPI0031F9C515
MAGVKFPFKDIISLLTLSIGLAKRVDENRAESMTVLYCNFADFSQGLISVSLEQILRSSDAILSYENHYFFILQYTDKYGATIVKDMFEEFFASYIESSMVSYPIDGEDSYTLLEELQTNISKNFSTDLLFLDRDRLDA